MGWNKEVCKKLYKRWVAAIKSRDKLGQYKDIIETDKKDPRGALVLFGPDLDEILEEVLCEDLTFSSSAVGALTKAKQLLRILYDGYKLNSTISASRLQVRSHFSPEIVFKKPLKKHFSYSQASFSHLLGTAPSVAIHKSADVRPPQPPSLSPPPSPYPNLIYPLKSNQYN